MRVHTQETLPIIWGQTDGSEKQAWNCSHRQRRQIKHVKESKGGWLASMEVTVRNWQSEWRVEGPKDKILGSMESTGLTSIMRKRWSTEHLWTEEMHAGISLGEDTGSKRLFGKTFCQAKPGDHFLLAWLRPGRNFLLWHCKTKGAKSYGVKGDVQTKSILWGSQWNLRHHTHTHTGRLL